jgi:hypothetical protein
MTHADPEGTMSGHNSWRGQGDDQGPPHPNARLPRVCLTRTKHGWPMPYPIVQIMLLSLGIPYVPYASVHFKCLFIQTQPTRALIDTGGGNHLGAPNLLSSPLSTLPSSILHFPLITPPGLQLCQPFNHLAKPHRTSIDRKVSIVSGFHPLVFYR